MDLEQRIGRIHRYGQQSTAQVYNLVATDTIEGKIFLLLEEKLSDIAYALGKVDEKGQIAEDLRAQVLGQLSNCVSYDRLYQDALDDPTLKRTRQELEVAMTNANLARQVVFELFQDLDRFNLGDYQKFDDEGRGMQRLITFVSRAVRLEGTEFTKKDETLWTLLEDGQQPILFTSDRDRALQHENLELLGLEHPVIRKMMHSYLELGESSRAVFGSLKGIPSGGLLTVWKVNTQSKDGQTTHHIVRIGITIDGDRAPWLEKLDEKILNKSGSKPSNIVFWQNTASQQRQKIQELLHRELLYLGIISEDMSYSAPLLAVFGIDN